MNLIKTLSHLGFQPSDYTISGSEFSMTPKSELVEVSPAVYDEAGKLVVEAEMEEVDVTPAKPSPEQLQAAWEEVQLKECDIALLINEYVKDAQRDPENDCLNIVEGLLHSFTFTHIARPTNAQLLALKSVVEAKVSQELINREAEEFLKSTDFYVIRMADSGIPMPEGMQEQRQQARDRIIR